MRRIGNLTAILIFLLFAALCGADISFTASVDRTTISEGEQVQLTLTLEGSGISGAPQPELPPMPDWDILGSTSSSSTSISIVGTKMESRVTRNYIYALAPRKTGTLTIPSVKINVGGKLYSTQPIDIEVVKGAPSQPPSGVPGGGRQGGQGKAGEPKLSSEQVAGDKVFISAWASKKKAYLGEKITVEFWLYTRLNVAQLSISKEPKMTGFWVSPEFTAKTLDYQTKVINGIRYSAALLTRYSIYALTAGKKTIEPMELVGVVQLPPRDFFDFWGRTEQVTIRSRPVEIEILPLPEANKPADFTGAVGDFMISASLDKTEIKTNEAFTLRIEVKGSGNFNAIQEPKIELPKSFDKYESHAQEKGNAKVFEIVLMPREKGEFVIPPVSFSFFNPATEKYRTVSTNPIKINVLQGKELPAPPPGIYTGTKEEVQVVGKDIAYIKPNKTRLSGPSSFVWIDIYYFAVIPLEILALGLAFAVKRRRERLITDIAFARSSRAYSKAKSLLVQAKRESEPAKFYSAIYASLFGFIVDKLNLPSCSLLEDIIYNLRERNFNEEFLSNLSSFFSRLEFARFAPQADEKVERNKVLKEASEILKILAKGLK